MAIEKSIAQAPSFSNAPEGFEDLDPDSNEQALEISVVNPDAVSIGTEDGGVIIDFDPSKEEEEASEQHDDNLAEFMEENDLRSLSSQLKAEVEGDIASRSDWERTYIDGLELLGLKIEDRTTPWPGACGVHHPILTEAVIRFQSQAIMEVFPSSGPVKTKIVGKITDDKEKQAHRIQDFMNYLILDKMTEYRPEMEQLLFNLPLAGSAFKKVYFDPTMDRPCAHFIPAEDFVVAYGATDLLSAERYAHVMRNSENEIRKLQAAGLYRDVDIGSSSMEVSQIQEKYNEIEGESPVDTDSRHVLLEVHADLDLSGYEDKDEDGEETGIKTTIFA